MTPIQNDRQVEATSKEKKSGEFSLPAWSKLRARMKTIKMPLSAAQGCATLDDFKLLAKKYYRIRIKEVHPDHVQARSGQAKGNGRRLKYGHEYNRVISAYRWIATMEEVDVFRYLKNRATVPDPELPLDWGLGWREYEARYTGFTVLPRL